MDDFILTWDDVVENKLTCPVCGHYYSSNGAGPQNNKILTGALQFFAPFSSSKFEMPSRVHDMTYMITPYMPVTFFKDNFEYRCVTREDCDNLYLILMDKEVAKTNFITRPYFSKAAEVYYTQVSEHGASSWKHEH